MNRSRRTFLKAVSAIGAATPLLAHQEREGSSVQTLRPGASDQGFDPWLELDASAVRRNVKEASRLAGGRPILAVVKNNSYGLGDQLMGPLLDQCDEVSGIACVRVQEALAMRAAGVRKPILDMAEVSVEEAIELARHDVRPSLWLDDAGERMDRVAEKLGRPVAAHLYVDCGMGREGMPDYRALDWMADLAGRKSVRVDGTYMMFVHQLEFNREQLKRFEKLIGEAKRRSIPLGTLHAAPTYELFFMPEAHFDMVRCGGALFGLYPREEQARSMAKLAPVFRLRARVVRLERLRTGDNASFRRAYTAARPTWMALLPVGHTDGYPTGAAGNCKVRIGERLYPVVSVVSSTHTLVEIGDEKTVEVGDVATLIGGDDPEISPETIASRSGTDYFTLVTKLSALLPRKLV